MSEAQEDSQNSKDFNKGCDARIAGKPIHDHPDKGNYHWRAGWWHVHRCWGIDAKRRPIQKLPPIKV